MTEHANTFLLVTILLFVTILLIFGMKYFSAARQAQARVTTDAAFRELAARATALQSEAVAARLSARRTRRHQVAPCLGRKDPEGGRMIAPSDPAVMIAILVVTKPF
jgi:hypothetical protein